MTHIHKLTKSVWGCLKGKGREDGDLHTTAFPNQTSPEEPRKRRRNSGVMAPRTRCVEPRPSRPHPLHPTQYPLWPPPPTPQPPGLRHGIKCRQYSVTPGLACHRAAVCVCACERACVCVVRACVSMCICARARVCARVFARARQLCVCEGRVGILALLWWAFPGEYWLSFLLGFVPVVTVFRAYCISSPALAFSPHHFPPSGSLVPGWQKQQI